LKKLIPTFGKNVSGISDEALSLLKANDWKGNIRELENVVQRAMLHTQAASIEAADLDFLKEKSASAIPAYDPAKGLETYVKSLTEQTERQIILETLKQTHWKRTEAAEKLQISRKTLFNKMQQYGIEQ
jgi:DNA-binding NtrC family response regulator